jgi:hypothetical protein
MIGINVTSYCLPTMVAHFEQRKVAETIAVAAFLYPPYSLPTKNWQTGDGLSKPCWYIFAACGIGDLITSSGRSASKGTYSRETGLLERLRAYIVLIIAPLIRLPGALRTSRSD